MSNTTRRRRSIRSPGYDYTQPGAYFVTICAHRREPLFGQVVDGEMVLNGLGEIVWECWEEIPAHFRHTELDTFVVMPNHLHGIIWIVGDDVAGARHAVPLHPGHAVPLNAGRRRAPTGTTHRAVTTEQFGKPVPGSIPTIVRSFKSAATRRINALRGTPGAPVWQRNYREHVIRDERTLDAVRRYIAHNPLRWHLDRYNAGRVEPAPWAAELWRLIQDNGAESMTGTMRPRCSVG